MLAKLLGRDKSNSTGVSLEAPVPDFIPYACHFDSNTILTKNGELLQIIKIIGFSSESVGSEQMDLRDVVRKAIKDNVKEDCFALWFHTVRRKRSLDPGGNFPPGFSESLNDAWNNCNKWDSQYVNELYVTILHDSMPNSLTNPKDFIKSLAFWNFKDSHENFIKESSKKLNNVVDGILETLKVFGANRLKIYKDQSDNYYSEPLQFFSKILNLTEKPVPVKPQDLSEQLATHKIAFGFNTLEVINGPNKRFGAIFTLKEYHEISPTSLDKFLQLPIEFIITQTLDFIDSSKSIKDFKHQHYLLSVSGDSQLSELSDLDNIISSDSGNKTDFGQSQITIMILDHKLEDLEKNIGLAAESLSGLGMVATRRDLRMEECFWSQLPGNFEFITRKKPISSNRVGGMASLYNFPAGHRSGNNWGPAVTAMHTIRQTPYFFDFHAGGNNGHTVILGPKNSGKTVLMNFLIAQAQKFNGKLFFFDQDRASKVFIHSMNGYYTVINPEEPSSKYAFNPLNIEDSEESREFLSYWLELLASSDGYQLSEEDKSLCRKAIDNSYSLNSDNRTLSEISSVFSGTNLEKPMQLWHGKGKYSHLFDNSSKKVVSLEGRIYGFGMSALVKNKTTLGPVLAYLLHRIEMQLDGTPCIIVLDEAWSLVNNSIFAPRLNDFLLRMQKKNAIVIFSTESMKDTEKSEITETISNNIATQIFLPDSNADSSMKAYKETWGLTEEQFNMLTTISSKRRELMLRQEGNAIITTLNLDGMKELQVLSGSDKTVRMMEEVVAQHGDNPEDWLPIFYEKFSQ